MEKRLQVALAAFLIVIFGCFSGAFAASRINTEDSEFSQIAKKISQISRHNIMNNGSSNHNKGDEGELGFENLNGSTENSAEKGDVLKKPEIGWKRYDDASKLIKYSGDWVYDDYLSSDSYNNTLHRSVSPNCEIKFKFNGTKLRIITSDGSDRSNNIKVTIDGINYSLDETIGDKECTMTFEISGLDKLDHEVTISRNDGDIGQINFDAVDIDSDGNMLSLPDGLTLNKTFDSLKVGETDNLVATVDSNDVPNSSMVWISTMPSVVSVDSSGKITALKPGAAIIVAGTKDGSNLMDLCTVTVR